MTISASQWGSPTASRRALLIHGMTMSSQSWEGIAELLVADGFFVVAPNLLGHAWRRSTDYRVSNIAEDLRSYFVMGTSYDVIIGHSFGGPVTLSLLPFLPKTKDTAIILLDPALELTEEKMKYMAENPAWSRRDCISRVLGMAMCDRAAIEMFRQNTPWSFSGLIKNIPPNVKITVLVSDPNFNDILESVLRDVERLNSKVLTGIGHWIQYEIPHAIMDEIPLPRAKL
ncbi:Alpha/Beta hydrolase protein [Suillus subaureus]|uniref:Alpha/Beta hydrolase protein n=1 Tax=Suillus subaureus TaxID=48587 RepID=A0A9P7EJH8_9AGAM|nr:Alpha/Beta hydrolase protein [Suillus subaureus]KAG1823667.1 Alpha/Beta hydrolase protein [Suillus subaureus]